MHKIITWIIKKTGVMVIVFLSLIMAGVFSYFELNKQEDPNFEVHEALITTTFPGAGSEEVEEAVTTEIESSIQGITEIDDLYKKVFHYRTP